MLLYTTGESPVFLFSQALSAAFSKTRAPFTQSIIILSPCLNAPPIIFMESGISISLRITLLRGRCAVQRLITLICKISLCIFSKLKFHPLFFHTFFKGSGLDFHDFCKLSKRQRSKGYNFIYPVYKFRLEILTGEVYELHHASCCQKANYQEEYRFRDCLS